MDTGGKIKSYYFLKALSQRHEIILVSFIRSEKEREYFNKLSPFCKRIEVCKIERSLAKNLIDALKSIFRCESFIVSRDFVCEMQNIVNKIIKEENPDFIHIDHLQMAQYIREARGGVKILDEHNVEYLIVKRIFRSEKNIIKKIFALLEYKKLKEYEKKAVSDSNVTLTVSEIDKKSLAGLTDNKVNIKTIPIGVDTSFFSYKTSEISQKVSLVFIGSLYWPPNIDAIKWFYREIWQDIKKEIRGNTASDIKWKIIGINPVKEVLKLTEMDKDIAVYGNVEDVRPFMWEEGIFIVPLLSGSGMRVKILNAMACGIPVVSTSMGAEGIEGLKTVTSHQSPITSEQPNIWIIDRPEEFVEAIVTLIKDSNLREELSRNGRKLMEERYDWNIQGKKLLNVYEEINEGTPM